MSELVSVVLPVFNRALAVRSALQSVLNQTYQNWEIVVVDDSSTDDTASVIEEHARKDLRIRLLRHSERRGAQAARNTGIEASQGHWVAFLDSDDQWLPDSLQLRLNLAKDKGLSVVHSECYVVRNLTGEPQLFGIPAMSGRVYKELLKRPGPAFPSLLVARAALVRIGYLDEAIISFQEWDTTIRLAKYYDFGFVTEPTFIWNFSRADSISKDLLRIAKGYEQVIKKYRCQILRYLGPGALALHYQTTAGFYQQANKNLRAHRCILMSIMFSPLQSKKVFRYGISKLTSYRKS
jgi:glycosyltransferase involved in cell wall biosynthesis